MSANDILDVLNIQRDDSQQPAKKRQKTDAPSMPKGSGMARELYNLIGPNTPPVSVNLAGKRDRRQKVSPWTRMPFVPNKKLGHSATFHHWEKGSKELLEASGNGREYYFDKFLVGIDIPEMVDEATYDSIMAEIREQQREHAQEKERQKLEKLEKLRKDVKAIKDSEKAKDTKDSTETKAALRGEDKAVSSGNSSAVKASDLSITTETAQKKKDPMIKDPSSKDTKKDVLKEQEGSKDNTSENSGKLPKDSTKTSPSKGDSQSSSEEAKSSDGSSKPQSDGQKSVPTSLEVPKSDASTEKSSENTAENGISIEIDTTATETSANSHLEPSIPPNSDPEDDWSYEETMLLFRFCKDFELKWHIINDRYPVLLGRSMEDLKEQFYRVCAKILKYNGTGNPSLLELLDAFSKVAEIDRKQYLESLLKRTPAEIAEEESLVIEARRFELAAKKMLTERSNLLTLLDSPQASQSVQQYLSSQGLTNLYNNLMILDKHQKKKMQLKSANVAVDPVPPPIPQAASSSHKKDRSFQTHLQQYLAGVLKQQGPQPKGSEPNAIQQLLAKRLTQKEEEAYGLMYHANEKLLPNVILRSTQKLPGLQQRQSVFKAVNNVLQELGIPTAGGTSWKPNMPTRKTMAKYDELVRSVVALLDVKKGKDKLEAEIALIKSQRNLQ